MQYASAVLRDKKADFTDLQIATKLLFQQTITLHASFDYTYCSTAGADYPYAQCKRSCYGEISSKQRTKILSLDALSLKSDFFHAACEFYLFFTSSGIGSRAQLAALACFSPSQL